MGRRVSASNEVGFSLQNDCDHVFLVGLARTGTTLMSDILNRSGQVGISMFESHYLADRKGISDRGRPSIASQVGRIGDLSTESGARQVVDFIYAHPEPFFRKIVAEIDPNQFLAELCKEPTDRGLFELAMRINAEGKRIRGEKTPGHIFYVPKLFEWFPDAKIIHMVRDPRATFVSQRKKRDSKRNNSARQARKRIDLLQEFSTSTTFIMSWRRVLEAHRKYANLYRDRYRVLRYEDLVASPQATLQGVCDFLNIEFSDEMITGIVNINSSYIGVRQTPGLDTQAIDRWRGELHPLIKQWFAILCNRAVTHYGYSL